MKKTEPNSKAWSELPAKIREALANNNLASLKPEERINLYEAICEHKGLDKASRPFEFITLNGKLQMYARKEAADQLREIHGVSTEIMSADKEGGTYVVQVRATIGDRKEDDIGATSLEEPEYLTKKDGTKILNPRAGKELDGLEKANAMMKAVTKAKRRATLSICGLGMMDESEIEAISEADKGRAPTVEEVKAIAEKIAALREVYVKTPKKEQAGIMAQITQLEDSIMDLPGGGHVPEGKPPQEGTQNTHENAASAKRSPSEAPAGQTTPETPKPAKKEPPVEKPAKPAPKPEPPAQEEEPEPEGNGDETGAPDEPAGNGPLASVPTDDWETHVLSGIPSKAMKGKRVSEIAVDVLKKIEEQWINAFIATIPDDPAKAKDAACILRAIEEQS